MKISLFISAIVFSVSSAALATVDFKKYDPRRAVGLVCTLVNSQTGHKFTDNQVTTFKINNQMKLQIYFLDSKAGNIEATVGVDDIESAQGGGNNSIAYSGPILSGAKGKLKGAQRLSIAVDMNSPLNNSKFIFASKIYITNHKGDFKELALPAWTSDRQLYCELTPIGY